MKKLFDKHGYTIIHLTQEGINAFWIRNDIIEKMDEKFIRTGKLDAFEDIRQHSYVMPQPTINHPDKIWVKAEDLLKKEEKAKQEL